MDAQIVHPHKGVQQAANLFSFPLVGVLVVVQPQTATAVLLIKTWSVVIGQMAIVVQFMASGKLSLKSMT